MIHAVFSTHEPDILRRRGSAPRVRTPQPGAGRDAAGFASLPAVTR